uniref:Fatty acid desaturase domain-containing protein n=1 Tax=Zooxanthella nutricula TaxID=1333877 RepID=A0A7S2LV63_9DINO|mmetsp:Transcript_6663/g.19827  ORF Transcript_6663/g.19827 Transcript_6663/m.19827 type:complete len:285 (+) Transcript_6663:2-856(+)
MRDHLIGSSLAAVMGISSCWWKRNHNTHHVVCNSVEHDPDIQHMPILAVTPKIWDKPYWSTYYTKWVSMDGVARFLVSNQHIVFYPMMALARFNLYAQSLIQLCSPEVVHFRKVELSALAVYFAWVAKVALSMPSWVEVVGWLLVSHAVAGILHVQIVISHWAMETYHGHAYNDDKDEWYITQLKTTMNVATPPALDFVHIGLQFQIEHHLYPRLPRHNLRKARELVMEVCKKHGIHYHEPGFWQANVETVQTLLAAARAARASKRGTSGFYESALWDGLKMTG